MMSPRLNPIVVKELRQGLKSKSFLVCFLGLQAFMVLCMAVYFQNVNSNSGLAEADGFFWFLIGAALLFFMPLRALSAIYNEMRGNTMELLFLTHMRSTQIAAGKWMAQAVQGSMLICSILPYFVLRYLLGRINIVSDFQTLGVFFLMSMVLLSAGIGLSAWKSRILRFLVIGAAVFSLMTVPRFLMMMAMGGWGGGAFRGFPGNSITTLLLAAVLIFYFLEHGAALISPPAENHARPKRILALLLHLILVGTGIHEKSMVWLVLSIVALFPQYLEFLSQPVSNLSTIYKKTRWFSPLRWFLLPGWVSAFLPVTLLLAASVYSMHVLFPSRASIPHLFPVLFAFLFFPVAVLELFRVALSHWRSGYLIVQAAAVGTGVVFLIIAEIQRNTVAGRPMYGVLNYIPFAALFQINEPGRVHLHASWTPAVLVCTLLLILLWRPLGAMRALSRQANSVTPAHDE